MASKVEAHKTLIIRFSDTLQRYCSET